MATWVVIVDDDVASLKMARSILKDRGMSVSAVRSGKELLSFVETNHPDLVLLDVLMPEMDGFETIQALYAFEENSGRARTPVIFLTSEDEPDTEEKGLSLGAADFIKKPFDPDVLVRRIEHTVRNSKTISNLTNDVNTDKLTKLFNRGYITKVLEEKCKSGKGALLMIDLDSFKLVNDIYGHNTGDEVLIAFANILKRSSGKNDIVGRIGGDEFLGYFEDTNEAHIAEFTKKLTDDMMVAAKNITSDSFDIPLGVSVGATYIATGGTYNEMFLRSDKALYNVKQNGKHGYAIFENLDESEVDDVVTESEELKRLMQILSERNALPGAYQLGQDDFAIVYQFVTRYMETYNVEYSMVYFSLHMLGDKDMYDAPDIFVDVLKRNLRKSDLFMKHKGSGFMLLLPRTDRQSAEGVADIIFEAWKREPYSSDIELLYAIETIENKACDERNRRKSDA